VPLVCGKRSFMNLNLTGKFLTCLLVLVTLTSEISSSDRVYKDITGKTFQLSGLSGKWILVNFWATWCKPCMEEIPDLVKLQQMHSDVAIVGIAIMYRNKKEIIEFVQNHSIPYSVVYGDEDMASDFGGLKSLPMSFLYSPSGKLVKKYNGPITLNELEDAMKSEEK
jgi:thiol-disulfide isomerase/thioredoxin